MPTVDTKYFGAMPYEEESCFEFPWGIPAFEEERRFLPIEMPGHKPLVFLQSTANPTLCFIALPVLAADPKYALAVSPDDLQALSLPEDRQPAIGPEVLVLTLLSIHEEGPATANLLAPVVVNLSNRRAVQAVRYDSVYSHAQALVSHKEEYAC